MRKPSAENIVDLIDELAKLRAQDAARDATASSDDSWYGFGNEKRIGEIKEELIENLLELGEK